MADEQKKEAILTGVRELDDRLGGGIPWGSLGIIEGHSDAGKSVLSQHLAYGPRHVHGDDRPVDGQLGAAEKAQDSQKQGAGQHQARHDVPARLRDAVAAQPLGHHDREDHDVDDTARV